jgi:ADP-ribose pyrophosphatase YjhB (NUDIX family)
MNLNTQEWQIMGSPGYAGTGKAARDADRDRLYGPGNWRTAFRWGEGLVDRDTALQLYEDAYYAHFSTHPAVLDGLCAAACDVYDNAQSNVNSGCDYSAQETNATHLQDIAIRRCVLRLGRTFDGDHLVEIRGKDSEGFHLNPGRVPFHLPERIVNRPGNPGWIQPGSIEDFWQSNKVLVVRTSALRPVLTVDVIIRNSQGRILLIDRNTSPTGWALPGGKVEFGESLRDAARREIKEETGLDISIQEQLEILDTPGRDPRHHMISVAFLAKAAEPARPMAGDGVNRARFFAQNGIPEQLVLDHRDVLDRYLSYPDPGA